MFLEQPLQNLIKKKGASPSATVEKQTDEERAAEIQAIHEDLEVILNYAPEKVADQAGYNGVTRGQVFISDLEEIFIRHKVYQDSYNFDRAWSQAQVDRAVAILDDYAREDEHFHNRVGQMVLSNFFLTSRKDGKAEDKGKTISDLFIRSIISRLEGDEGVAINLQMSISNWAQNIHMVDKDILLDFIVAMHDHPEKFDPQIRYTTTMGVGLFPSLIKPLSELAEKKDISSRLKVLSALKALLNISKNSGFKGAGVEARDLLEESKEDQSNYFCSTRAEQIEEDLSGSNRDKRRMTFFKYHEPQLAAQAPDPLFLENNAEASSYMINQVRSSSCYSRLSTATGVIYNGYGEVDSYFGLKDGKRLTLPAILEQEGFVKTPENREEYETKLKTYKALIELPLRSKIEEEFSISLADFSIREQLQFMNFISTKSVLEVGRAKDFILAGDVAEAKSNRFKSFLALEAGSEIGEDIIAIGESLADQPAVEDRLFAKQADLTKQINEQAGRFSALYGEIFFEKSISRDALAALALKKTSGLIVAAREKLAGAAGEEKEKIVADLIGDLDEEVKNVSANLEELKSLAASLNAKYNAIGKELLRSLDPDHEDISSFDADSLYESGEFSREEIALIERDAAKHKKYDSQRLKRMIEYYKQEEKMEREAPALLQRIKVEGEWNEAVRKDFEALQDRLAAKEESRPGPEQARSLYRQTIERLEQILPFQIALEKKLDQLIYGREDVRLARGFGNFENDPVKPEEIPDQTPLYFPVGISKDLPAWERVLSGEQKAVKPIDIYGYLFWLNNQERPVSLVVCDELQVSNYTKRFGKDEASAREGARQIGNREALQYKKIIDTFGLENLHLQTYGEFLESHQDKFQRYQGVVENLAAQPAFKEAFLAMVQDSVSGAEKEEYINYALEELAWILSADGTKIGHLNEARYDILAAVISNWEKLGQKKNIDVLKEPGQEEAQAILSAVCRGLRDAINEKKSKLERNSPAAAYYQRLQEHLKKVKPEGAPDKNAKKEPLDLNFVCPEVGSASFGWRGDFDGKESVVKFKEPYSTYFYKDSADLLIDSDQVVAAGEGYIGGKILTLEAKKQQKYAESVVRPILKHYFNHLDKAPERYFEEAGKSASELRQESAAIVSLLDAIRFIQKYIIRPTELV